MPRERPFPRGMTATPFGWRLSLGPKGSLFQKRYRRSRFTREEVEDELRKAQRAQPAGKAEATTVGLAADVASYLTDYFTGRPGYEERDRHLKLWLEALGGDTPRAAITREDVSRTLHGWRASGLSPDTCNKRRAALLAFFNTVNGKGGQNTVRDVPKFRVAAPLPRGIDYALITKAFRKLPLCRTRARLKVMAYTGARPIQVRQITADDWDEKGKTLLLRSTDKGRGTKPHRVPLSAAADAALREFENTDAWGTFTAAPMARMWKAAAMAVGLPKDVRPYDLRHSFGTEVYRTTGDLRITKELMGQSSFAMAERYTLAAIPDRQRMAIDAMDSAAQKRRPRRSKLPVKVATRRKRSGKH